jgi:hypothetical protein
MAGIGVAACGACHVRRKDELGNNYSEAIWGPRSSQLSPYGTFLNRIRKGTKEYEEFRVFLKTYLDPTLGELYRKSGFKFVETQNGDIALPDNNNIVFTEDMASKARYSAAKEIERTPDYKKYQYAIFGSFFGCRNIRDFLPEKIRKQQDEQFRQQEPWEEKIVKSENILGDIQEYVRSTNQKMGDPREPNLLHRVGIASPGFEPPPGATAIPDPVLFALQLNLEKEFQTDEYTSAIASLFYLFHKRTGFRARTPLNLPKDNYFTVQYRIDGGLEGLRQIVSCHLGPDFLADNPDMRRFFKDTLIHPDNLVVPLEQYCAKLQEKSLSAF